MATRTGSLAMLFACSLALASPCVSQALRTNNSDLSYPRVEVYAGYSYWHPVNARINGIAYNDLPWGAEGSLTYFVNHWLGIQAEGGAHVDPVYGAEFTTGVGVQVQTNARAFVPFAHLIGGPSYFGGPALQQKNLGWNGTIGGGLDWVPSSRHQWLAVRLFQADYQYNYNNFGKLSTNGLSGGIAHMNTFAGSTGLVARFGTHESVSMETQMSCSVDHVEVYAGDPVTAGSQFLGLDVKRNIDYNWTTTGGKLSGPGQTVSIDTSGLAPGDYTVAGTVSQGHHGKHTASCRTGFTVRQYEPPTLTCTATPSTIAPGQSSTVTASAISRQSRSLTYTFSTSTTGRIPSSGNQAVVTAQHTGDMTIICNVADDLGLVQSANTVISVVPVTTVAPASVAPLPLQQDMCAVSFERDRKRPARVDNEAKACLDDIALAMQHDQEATLMLVADHRRAERASIAAERAVNVKQYLTVEKGIDPIRIKLRALDTGAPRVTSVFLPGGATFNEEGHIVHESQVVRHGEAYGTGQHVAAAPPVRHRPVYKSSRRVTKKQQQPVQ